MVSISNLSLVTSSTKFSIATIGTLLPILLFDTLNKAILSLAADKAEAKPTGCAAIFIDCEGRPLSQSLLLKHMVKRLEIKRNTHTIVAFPNVF